MTMTSEELADKVHNLCTYLDATPELTNLCTERVLGPGNEQYSFGDTQVFESLPIEQLSLMFDEEIADAIVYAVMLCIRFRELGVSYTVQLLEDFAGAIIAARNYLNVDLQGIEYAGKYKED